MSPISGIDSNSLLSVLSNSLNNSASPKSSSNTDSTATDTQQATPASATTSIDSLLELMKISFLRDQYSFMTSLFGSEDSTSPDSLAAVLGNAETDKINNMETSNPQIAQLINILNSSSSSAASNDPTTFDCEPFLNNF